MSMLDVHRDALAGTSGPFHEFLLAYKLGEPMVYGFVEGKEDPHFYKGLIESMLPQPWRVRLIRSGNKDAVLSLLSEMDWGRFPKKRICFFVDRDLSAFLGEDFIHEQKNLYVTDGYSIENDIVISPVFERVIEEVLNVTELAEAERDSVVETFEQNAACFKNSLAPLMAQIVLWRRTGYKPQLGDVKLNTIFRFNEGRIVVTEDCITKEGLVKRAASAVGLPKSTNEDLAAAEAEFRAKRGVERFVRGKYLLWFFVTAAVALHEAIPRFCAKHSRPPKMRVAFGPGNALMLIAPRARIPDSLREFISCNFLEYIVAHS